MIVSELQALLQRFPPEAQIDLIPDQGNRVLDLGRVELKLDDAPIVLDTKNATWADLVKERVRVRLVGTEKVAAALPKGGIEREP